MKIKKLIEIIEVWNNDQEFIEELQDFINRQDIDVSDIQYSTMQDSQYTEVGYTAMIIYVKKQLEEENDNE